MSRCTVQVTIARYYDPTTAQFLTRDPLEAETRSAYGYVAGDPLDGSDPSGLCWGPASVCDYLAQVGQATVALGDLVTLGGSRWVRHQLGLAGNIECSDAYQTEMNFMQGPNVPGEVRDEIVPPDDPEVGDGLHGILRAGERSIDEAHVWSNYDSQYIQTSNGAVVRVIDNGNGTSDVVIRYGRNATGTDTVMQVPNRYVQTKLQQGNWTDAP